ncbi:MAG: ribonuclease P protein component [Candidatus Buchananbacteria bacterium RBG_13_39_9]|uniref:Ribonuclease P protein component n=1 Tax=Candidatus Buchananbacteria bacterium RBG_13_39_9 TaxID=1797531 RepID=A0A1G1XN76_9BACT|nr:MAG: ribonuclease P protein component [Candidatus Buchananbacteria bacterium RBG_13_39_9]
MKKLAVNKLSANPRVGANYILAMAQGQNRLSKTKEIQSVMKKGRAYYCPVFMIKVLKNTLGYMRFAIIVSNKVSKKATVRNLIKRRFREMMRLKVKAIKTGADLVILASPKIISQESGKALPYKNLNEALSVLLKKANLL